LVVGIAIVIMLAIYFVRIYFRHQIEKNEMIYEQGIKLIEIEKNYKKALEQFYLYLEEKPNDIETKYSIGYCYYMNGNFNKAIDYFSEVLKYDKSHFISMDYLAKSYIYAKKKEFYKEAINLLEKSEAIMKEDSYLWDQLKDLFKETKAWVYYNVSDIVKSFIMYDEAIPIYKNFFREKMKDFDECFAEVHYHFGIIYKHKKDFSNAKMEFEKAIKAGGPQNIFSQRSITELGNLK